VLNSMFHDLGHSMIQISGLKKVFPTESGDIVALENVDLAIKRGEIFGIIGLSGAGKSTLIRCINLLERPTAGRIFIDGTDISDFRGRDLKKLRSSIGIIFQNFNLLMQRSVEENIAFPLEIARVQKKLIKTRVLELLELVGLSDKLKAYPAQLSGGQKQRVAIARALANNPKVLLCDEATSALDPLTTHSILALLKEINRKLALTIVLITHEMGVIKAICDRVAVIDKHRIVECGPVLDMISRPQTDSARHLLRNNLTDFSPEVVFPPHRNQHSIRIKIIFTGKSALEPVVSNLARHYNLDANILFGNIEFINKEPLGELILELSGREKDVAEAFIYLDRLNLKYEVQEND